MSSVEFRIVLVLLGMVALAHIAYSAPRTHELRANERAARFGWIAALSPTKRMVLAGALLAVAVCGLLGLLGMFFFSKAAAIAFLVATITVEVGGRVFFRGGGKSPLEWALANSTTAGSILVLYLAFIGPAKELFT
jgi:hypothetical protein